MAYLAIGVDLEGRKYALGCWIHDTEGAEFWQKVAIDLRNRGVHDILIACCNGSTGLPDAIRSIYPDTVVQTCVVHVICNAVRFVSYKDRRKVATSMRSSYSAPTVDAAELALEECDRDFGGQYPGATDVWRNAWGEFTPLLDYPVELHKIVYITNAIRASTRPSAIHFTTAANLVAHCHRAAIEGHWATTMRLFAGPGLLVIATINLFSVEATKRYCRLAA